MHGQSAGAVFVNAFDCPGFNLIPHFLRDVPDTDYLIDIDEHGLFPVNYEAGFEFSARHLLQCANFIRAFPYRFFFAFFLARARSLRFVAAAAPRGITFPPDFV
jgi:hypothetical protein